MNKQGIDMNGQDCRLLIFEVELLYHLYGLGDTHMKQKELMDSFSKEVEGRFSLGRLQTAKETLVTHEFVNERMAVGDARSKEYSISTKGKMLVEEDLERRKRIVNGGGDNE